MVLVKRIVCLANSRKLSGRCVAGREINGSKILGWIRPVSASEHQEVSDCERRYSDGGDPAMLDVIDVPLLRSVPETYQQENWRLDPDRHWVKAGEFSWAQLMNLVDPVETLWTDGDSTYNGKNDKIPDDLATRLTSSLRFVRVRSVRLRVFSPGADFDNPKRRVQARFDHAGSEYALWVTDPIYEKRFLAQEDGYYDLGECYLTISLGEPYGGATYKLVAAILEPSILTVGHSNHSPEDFIELLRKHHVTAVADVRSTPFSQYTPQFNKETLKPRLKRAGIRYAFLGRELGARPDNASLYVNKQVDYSRMADTDLFKEGIKRLLRGAKDQRIAIMSAEKDPLNCHRCNLISRALIDNGIEVHHILEDGQLESIAYKEGP